MSKTPPRPGRHLHVFAVSLIVLVAVLAVFLFGVKMEDSATGKGVVTSARIIETRAPGNGKVILDAADDDGTGSTIVFPVRPGEVVVNGAVFGAMILDAPRSERLLLCVAGKNGKPPEESGRKWLLLEIAAKSGQHVNEGDLIARFVEVDPADPERILEPRVRLEIEEKHFGEVRTGQEVRLYSSMYHHRVYGSARGEVGRLEPAGEAGPNGNRIFHAWVAVNSSPFPLKLGSSVRAEIVVGRKPTYQIILEH